MTVNAMVRNFSLLMLTLVCGAILVCWSCARNDHNRPAPTVSIGAPSTAAEATSGPGERPTRTTPKVRVPNEVGSALRAGATKRKCGDAEILTEFPVSTDGGVPSAFIAALGAETSGSEPAEVALRIERCAFEPKMLATRAAASVFVATQDVVPHNLVVEIPGETQMHHFLAAGAESLPLPDWDADAIQVSCELHSWEHSAVVKSRFAHTAISSASGGFEFAADLPSNVEALLAWHPVLGVGFNSPGKDIVLAGLGNPSRDDVDGCCMEVLARHAQGPVLKDVCHSRASSRLKRLAVRGLLPTESIPAACGHVGR